MELLKLSLYQEIKQKKGPFKDAFKKLCQNMKEEQVKEWELLKKENIKKLDSEEFRKRIRKDYNEKMGAIPKKSAEEVAKIIKGDLRCANVIINKAMLAIL